MTPRPLHPADPTSIGPYTLLGVLGEGSQGAVYLGTFQGRRVAVKLMHERHAQDARARRRFVRELEAAKKVARFCTAQVLDADTQGDCPYIVSEYVPGPSLQTLVREEGPRAGGALERLAVSTLTALAAIHRAGFVHRDFKPANIIMGPDGQRVVDFGIARALDVATSGGRVGTLPYMSPEQLNERPLTPASDLFSWASCMLFAATATSPFAAAEAGATVHRILNTRPDTSPLPRPLRDVVEACLDQDPAARPDAAQAHALLLGDQAPAPTATREDAPFTAPDPAPDPAPRRLTSVGVVFAAGLATAAVVALGTTAAWDLPRTGPDKADMAVSTASPPPTTSPSTAPPPTSAPADPPSTAPAKPADDRPPEKKAPPKQEAPSEQEESSEPDVPKNDPPPAAEQPQPAPSAEQQQPPPANDPAPAYTAPPRDAVYACDKLEGDGFYVLESRAFPGGTLHLLYSKQSRLNCVAVIKTADVGTPTPIWAEITRKSDGHTETVRGSYRYYATTSILAPGICVRIAGGGPHGQTSVPWGHCD